MITPKEAQDRLQALRDSPILNLPTVDIEALDMAIEALNSPDFLTARGIAAFSDMLPGSRI